ncbi:hypothetical protein Scani_34110 [Streptomyces caniferus]|uniref:Uncharacterized protein n=1 Tax=Streptomyces caniferus TaxID=285557 RepID=A0A640S6N1_9ACTN|nr:hypothetical protein Scani_34110 [Streptomyces caniferus]
MATLPEEPAQSLEAEEAQALARYRSRQSAGDLAYATQEQVRARLGLSIEGSRTASSGQSQPSMRPPGS